MHAATIAEARDRVRQSSRGSVASASCGGSTPRWRRRWPGSRPTQRCTGLGRPQSGALDVEPDSRSGHRVVHADRQRPARRGVAACDAIIEAARPRGWLIALALGSHMRAMALVPAGRIREAELDARLAFDYKLAAAPVASSLAAVTPS